MRIALFERMLVFLLLMFASPLYATPAADRSPDFSLTQISSHFPAGGFENEIAFWRAVFTRYGNCEVILHDRDDLRIIYDVFTFDRPATSSSEESRKQQSFIKQKKEEVQSILRDLVNYSSSGASLSARHQEMAYMLTSQGYVLSGETVPLLQLRLRHQRGIKEKFREGLIRSCRYLPSMEKIFKKYDLPIELAALPHIESSFENGAYSRVGAAGIWQFMPATGRRFLRIDRHVDERLNALKATEAAARLLKENYSFLQNWPLAITAYNHGTNGMRRARNQFGSDLRHIVDNYQSKTFGFASKNFYAEFLAAVEVSRNYRHYFGELPLDLPQAEPTQHRVQRGETLSSIAKKYGSSVKLLQERNALSSAHLIHPGDVLLIHP